MRKLTQDIIGLKLFEPLEVTPMVPDSNNPSHDWETPDVMILLENNECLLMLCIEEISEHAIDDFSVCLTKQEIDTYGDVFLTDNIWTVYGSESEILSQLKAMSWNLTGYLA